MEVPQVQDLRSLVATIGSTHGQPPGKAWQWFVEDVKKNYDTRLGLEPEVVSLETRKKQLTEGNASLERTLGERSKQIHDEIETLNGA